MSGSWDVPALGGLTPAVKLNSRSSFSNRSCATVSCAATFVFESHGNTSCNGGCLRTGGAAVPLDILVDELRFEDGTLDLFAALLLLLDNCVLLGRGSRTLSHASKKRLVLTEMDAVVILLLDSDPLDDGLLPERVLQPECSCGIAGRRSETSFSFILVRWQLRRSKLSFSNVTM